MSTRTVILVQDTDRGEPQISLIEPLTHQHARKGFALQLTSPQPFKDWWQGAPVTSLVQQAGSQLYKSLTKHPAIKEALDQAGQARQDDQHPIYFYIDPTEIDELPWETLHEDNLGFLALDRRWPIARLRNPIAQVKQEYVFSLPLRVLAVLSAAGGSSEVRISGREEWERIYESLKSSNLDFSLRVLLCEEELKQHIEGLADNRVQVAYVVDKDSLTDDIVNFGPHLLHFFCHGTADQLPCLKVGNRADWEAERDGSIVLEANELRQRADPHQCVWLLTLNCCESAKQAPEARCLASALVIAGFPAVVGMREPVKSDHANAFCGLFYREALKLIASAPVGNQAIRIEWASALWHARATLCNLCKPLANATEAATNCKEWTIPVLYARIEPFLLRRAQVVPGMNLADRLERLANIDALRKQRDEFVTRQDVDNVVKRTTIEEFNREIRRIEDELKT